MVRESFGYSPVAAGDHERTLIRASYRPAMTRPTTLIRLSGGLGAATLAAGLAMAAPLADADHSDGDHGGHGHGGGTSGPGGGSGSGSGSGHGGNVGDAPSHLDLPDGFRPEGIATGSRHTAYLGSLADGDILA